MLLHNAKIREGHGFDHEEEDEEETLSQFSKWMGMVTGWDQASTPHILGAELHDPVM